ncbi:MAG: hypothetical protein KAG53_12225, partial [Endozoicomonadaceae bacterium]|nr:hypothetical protein [Endozoicomonadaceae bacterium]
RLGRAVTGASRLTMTSARLSLIRGITTEASSSNLRRKRLEDGICPKNFLDREKKASLKYKLPSSIPKIKFVKIKKARALRDHWLELEKNALTDEGRNPSKDKLLNDLLVSFYDQLANFNPEKKRVIINKSIGITEKLHKRANDNLQSLHNNLDLKEKTILALNKEIKKYGLIIGAAEQKLLDETANGETEQIETLKRRLASAEDKHLSVKKQIEILMKSPSSKNIQTKTLNNQPADDHNSEIELLTGFIESLQETYDTAKLEISRLREANKEKRELVLKLESSLTKQPNIKGDSIDLVQKLKLQIRDSELCSAMLEEQTDSLRETISTLYMQLDDPSDLPKRTHDAESYKDDFGDVLLSTINNITTNNDEESLANTLYELGVMLNIDTSFVLRNNGNEYWCSTNDNLSPELKNRLLSFKPSDDIKWVDINLGCVLALQKCSILLQDISTSDSPFDLTRLAKPFHVANSAMKRIELMEVSNNQKTLLNKLIKRTRSAISKMEVQHNLTSLQGKEAMEVFQQEMEGFLNTVEISQTQQKCLIDINDELAGRMDLLFQSSGIIDKSYIDLMKLLE